MRTCGASTRTRRAAVSPRSSATVGDGDAATVEFSGRHRGRRLWRGQLGRPAAAFGQRPASAGPGQQLGRGGPALHAPQQPGPDGRVQGTQRHQVPEDPGAARLVSGLRRLGLPPRRHPDAGQVRLRADPRRGAPLGRCRRPRHALRGARPPRGRLLAVRRGSARRRQPRHPGPGRRHPPGPRREEQHRRAEAPAAPTAKHARPLGHARTPSAVAQHLPAQGHAHRRHRASGGHGPLRRATPKAPRSTSTARPTTSTTSTSSTRASSPASVRSTPR